MAHTVGNGAISLNMSRVSDIYYPDAKRIKCVGMEFPKKQTSGGWAAQDIVRSTLLNHVGNISHLHQVFLNCFTFNSESLMKTSFKTSLFLAVGSMALSVLATPAFADNIVTDQWYTAHFGDNPPPTSPVLAGAFQLGVHGPLPGGGFGDAIASPGVFGDAGSWVITLPSSGWITFTDMEISGDQFQIFIDGVAASLAVNNLTPSGQTGLAGGLTSTPNPNASSGVTDISVALADANYSSGTFALHSGTNTITANFLGTISNGDLSFLAHADVPEPASLSLFGLGFAGMFAGRRKSLKQS